MDKSLVLTGLLFFLSLSLGACNGCSTKKSELTNLPVLVVGDAPLSAKEFALRIERRLRGVDPAYARQEIQVNRVKEDVIRGFIQEVIVANWARKNDVAITPEELEGQISKVRSSYPNDLMFRKALASENLSLEDWTTNVRRSILERRVLTEVTKTIPNPDEGEALKYYESHKDRFKKPARIRMRQVVIAKEDEARRLYEEIKKGAPIERMARQFSIAPEASNGGDTGWIEKGTLEVFDRVFDKNVGFISDVLKSSYGYHIIQVLEKRPAVQLNFQQAKASIFENLRAEQEQGRISEWLESEIKTTKVFRDDKLIQAVQVFTEGQR